ncbi:MAG: hypothetical protein ACTSP7_03935, partial [Candidatus Heimdallarchaeota archaeon]
MVDKRTRPFRKMRRKYTFIILAVLSGIITSIWIAIDTYTGSALVVDSLGVNSNPNRSDNSREHCKNNESV